MTRNKKALGGIIMNALVITILLLGVYYQLGQWGGVGFAGFLSVDDINGANKAFSQYI